MPTQEELERIEREFEEMTLRGDHGPIMSVPPMQVLRLLPTPYYGIWGKSHWWMQSDGWPICHQNPGVLLVRLDDPSGDSGGRVALIPPDGGEPTEFYEPPKR